MKDSDNSSGYTGEQFISQTNASPENKNQDKLAKNRESARNSRKRKKIYVELLETKVSELTEEISQLKETCRKY
jgi:hypothetical protein